DAAVGGDGISLVCTRVALGQCGTFGAAARIRVLDDGRGGCVEFGDQLPGGVEIDEVVVGKLLAVKLGGSGNAGGSGRVKRRGLVRILTITEGEGTWGADVEDGRKDLARRRNLGEARADGSVISGGGGEGLFRKAPVGFTRQRTS